MVSHEIELFEVDPNSMPFIHDFRTHENVVSAHQYNNCCRLHGANDVQAQQEQAWLTNVQNLVKAGYIDGRPRHHHPDARNPDTDASTSVFFIAHHDDFMGLEESDIQRIFQERHIIVTDIPCRKYGWELPTLLKMGSLEQQREIQGKPFAPIHILHGFANHNSWDVEDRG